MTASTPRWSPARCQFTLIAITALIDRKLTSEEEFEALAVGARAGSMHELDVTTTQGWLREVVAERNDDAALKRRARRAIEDFPKDQAMRRAIYAHCADIAFADRTLKSGERRFLGSVAKDLGLARTDQRKINAVMALKNRH